MNDTITPPPSIREFLTANPIGAESIRRLCAKHGVDLDSPWPPRFPKDPAQETAPEQAAAGQLAAFPPWTDTRRAAPNAVFRSALFPALNFKAGRPFLKAKKIASIEGVTVFFTGEQFDQSDLDVYLELLNFAREYPLGTEFEFSAYALLKALGRNTGSTDYQWLHSVLVRLRSGTVDMTDHKIRYFGGLIEGGFKDEISKHYRITINPRFAILFGYGMWSSIDREQRRALGRDATAKALHAYYSTHANPTAHNIETLCEIAGVNNSNKRQARATIIKAHERMKSEKVGFLSGYEVTADKIKADIIHTPGQARAILKKAAKAAQASKENQRRNKPTLAADLLPRSPIPKSTG